LLGSLVCVGVGESVSVGVGCGVGEGSSTIKSSVAESPAVVAAPSSAVIALVMLVKLPPGADSGTSSVTSKALTPPGAREPPERLSDDVPESCDPAPQMLLTGRPMALRPGNAASRSSVKAISVRVWVPLLLTTVNSRFTVSPGMMGSSVKAFDKEKTSVG